MKSCSVTLMILGIYCRLIKSSYNCDTQYSDLVSPQTPGDMHISAYAREAVNIDF